MNNTKPKTENVVDQIALIHIGNREKSGLQIFEKLKQYNYSVLEYDVLNGQEDFNYSFENFKAVIVNIGYVDFEYDDLLDKLFEKEFKVIINEASLSNDLTGLNRISWERHLLNKIDSKFSLFPKSEEEKNKQNLPLDLSKFGIKNVWILAASIGGPEAIKDFLEEYGQDNSTLFIIVQHMDKEFVPNLIQQLNEVSQIQVKSPISGMELIPSVLIYPTDERLTIDDNGRVELKVMNEEPAFIPCIDLAVKTLVNNINDLNMAVFSGMCTDGIKAAEIIKNNGGKVILQSEESCVLSTIISGIKKNIKPNYEADPKSLAKYVLSNNVEN